MMNRHQAIPGRLPFSVLSLAAALFMLVFPTGLIAAERLLPGAIQPGVNYLLALTDDPRQTTIDSEQLTSLVNFILADKADDDQYYGAADPLLDPLVYHEFELQRSLATILEYAFHPVIPSHVFALSSVRHAYWKEVNGQPRSFPGGLAKRMQDLRTPLVIHGIEHEEIAPDLFTGAYYSYDLARTLVLCRVDGRTVWISLARQRDLSDVGRKGFVLGPDDSWDFIYSGEKGINKMGLGWVESYMYDAFSAIVYIQEDETTPRVRCGIFKWLRAGWSDMNFVRRNHIRRGLERYAKTFQEILETPRLPAPFEVAAAAREIGQLSRAQLQERGRQHLRTLEAQYAGERRFPREWYTRAMETSAYLDAMTRPQLEAMLFLDYMQKALGRHPDQARSLAMGAGGATEPTP